jgi:exodeoxyribonuclease V beta subunit
MHVERDEMHVERDEMHVERDEMHVDGPAPFELLGALPRGTVVLEASAGTGKTYAIAALATRYVAEAGVALSELLLVTFTKAATAELRDRVRRRMVEAGDHLSSVLAGNDDLSSDPLLDHLARAPVAELRVRQRRLADAVTEFDTATISTIHGFCQQVLSGIGLAADVPREITLLEDEDLLLEQVVHDTMVTRFLDRPGAPGLRTVLAAAKAAVDDPDADILPDEPAGPEDVAGDDPDATARLVADLAREVRSEMARRKRTAAVLSHQDLLTRLCDAVRDPEHGAAAVAVLRDRYRVALIDEFQDTDPVQWEILERAFSGAAGQRALVLIGDPKQAIYSFRGADVRAYLRATRGAARFTLPTNWRSDGVLITALNHLFGGTVYGDVQIVHRHVSPAPGREGSRLAGPDGSAASTGGNDMSAPLSFRAITEGPTPGSEPSAASARAQIPADVAAEVVRTLGDDGPTIDGRHARPRDIAVLVRANRDAAVVQQALRAARVPAVINGVGSVFATTAAGEWLQLLETLERPSSSRAARRLAVTAFGGWDAQQLVTADEAAWDAFHEQLHTWSDVLTERGVAGLLRAVIVTAGVSVRLLKTTGGERHLTDLHHVGELLHAAQLEVELGPTALSSWLRERIDGTQDAAVPPDEQARRLESDAEAVQILTVHRSKGLEFPIVLCPYLWSAGQGARAPLTVAGQDGGPRLIDVGPAARSGYDLARDRWTEEKRGEDLRLLYVAATRARHRVVLWWVASKRNASSSLCTVLFARDEGDRVSAGRPPTLPHRDETLAALQRLAAACGGTASLVPTDPSTDEYAPPGADADGLRLEPLERWIDRRWRRTSFSGLASRDRPTRGGQLEHLEDTGTTDDEDLEAAPRPDRASGRSDDGRNLREVPLPLSEVPGSAELGTMLHAVLEHADFAAADLEVELAHHLDDQQARHLVAHEHRDSLLEGLVTAVRTPLGPLTGDLALAAFDRRHRLDEPRFELPLAGGDAPGGRAPAALARVAELVEHHLAPEDPLCGYHERLRDPRFDIDLRGYLNGAIDLVLRVPDGLDRDRYLVIDHKTNRLGWPEIPTSWHYRPEGMAVAMQDGHYPLQALIYSVALHRLLRWRLPDYDPSTHLGGVAYLFLRGMTGPRVPRVDGQPCGVFAWRPPAALVTDLSELLDGRLGAPSPPRVAALVRQEPA